VKQNKARTNAFPVKLVDRTEDTCLQNKQPIISLSHENLLHRPIIFYSRLQLYKIGILMAKKLKRQPLLIISFSCTFRTHFQRLS
jgi:hypothetical protein